MANFLNIQSEFLDQIIEMIEERSGDENFGVSELAEMAGMSRSNLLRKVQKLTGVSVSVLIRNVRLNNAQQLLENDTLNVSEVAFQTGFNSVSYFIRCYRERYGFPPGEQMSHKNKKNEILPENDDTTRSWSRYATPVLIIIAIVIATIYFTEENKTPDLSNLEKSIAVLPFKNDSNDSSNIYLINGLMEAILNNLQKINDLRVISRTTVEKYRNERKTIAEISKELGVNYIIEGSGQKVGDKILLTVQLIEAPRDGHLWSEQYNRSTDDIFKLQAEVAKDIASEIEVIISPEVEIRINKPATNNLVAYDYYLKGREITRSANFEGLEKAVTYFQKALEEDQTFALAHASIAICYYYLDAYKTEKKHTDDINTHADKALLLDPELGASLMAKGLYYMQTQEFELAIEYFEKTLKYHPNSADAYNFLSDIYNVHLPNSMNYLRYALKGIQLDKTAIDSAATSISYLHVSNALVQNGFLKESETYIKKSLEYDSSNIFSQYVYAYIKLAQDKDFFRTKALLTEILMTDTTRLDVLQELAKIHYTLKEYDTAHFYYHEFVKAREQYGLNIFVYENLKIGFVYQQMGNESAAQALFDSYLRHTDTDESIYKELSLAAYYAVMGDVNRAVEFLKVFAEKDEIQYWFVLFLKEDPIINLMSDHPDFEETLKKIEDNFWEGHRKMRKKLEQESLL